MSVITHQTAPFEPLANATLLGMRVQRWRNGGARIGIETGGEIVWGSILTRDEAERFAGLLIAPGEP